MWSISLMNTAAHPGWSSSNTKEPGPDIIRWNSLGISTRDISPAMDTSGISQPSGKDHRDRMHGPCEAQIDESLTVLKKDFTKEQLKETTAYQAMARIGMLYKIEEMIRDKSPEERYEERQKQAKPLLEAFFEWLHTLEDAVDRSSKIGEAVLYTLNQETYLKRYLEDGQSEY